MVKVQDDPFAAADPLPPRKVVPIRQEIGMEDVPFPPTASYDERGGEHQFREINGAEREVVAPMLFRPWAEMNLAEIPAPEFVYSDFYARGYTSVTLAAPKVGKSALGLAEAIDITTGRGFLTGVRREPQRVVYYNAEDDQNTINSRVAALLTAYDIPQSEIIDRIHPHSGVGEEAFYMVSGIEGVINERLFVSIEKFIELWGADVLIFDPLQDLTHSPETNEVFRALGQRLRKLASLTGVALGLIHHTRKVASGMTPTIDDGRGGSALRGTARFNRLLVGMTEEEAEKGHVANHRHFFRVGDVESNLAPPSSDVNRWFEKVSILTPNGHKVVAVKRWEWPDAFEGISAADARLVRNAVQDCKIPPRENHQSRQWVGLIVADTLGIDLDDKGEKSRVLSLIKTWIKNGVLALDAIHDTRTGRETKTVTAGPNIPGDTAP